AQADTGLSATSMVVNVTVTNAAAPGPWSFGIISDTQWTVTDDGKNPNSCAADIISQVNQELINKGAKFAIAIGDLCDNGSTAGEDARAAYAQSLYNAGIAFFPLRGNHDSTTTEFQRIYPQTGGGLQNNTPSDVFAAGNDSLRSPPAKTGSAFSFGLNYSTPSGAAGYSYSFDYNNARIILLDQFISAIDSQQSWITSQLSGKGASNHGFVFGHKGLITESHADNLFGSSPAADPAGTDAFISSLATNKVHYYIGGHDHMHDYTVVSTTDGVTAHVSELVCASDSSKFYTPTATANDITYDVPAFGHARQTPVAQDLYEIGYYLVTVDGPRVTVNYYAVPSGSSGADISTTPPLTGHWVLKHTFGYSLNGQEFMVPQGQQYTNVQDAIAAGGGFTGTHMTLLNGTNASKMKDASNRALVKQIDTGWSPATGNLVSDVLTLWGMKNLGSSTSDTYALSVSYNPAAGTPRFLACKDANGNWTNAVTLNSGGASQFVSGPYTPGAALGTYGLDTNTMTVWAVVNYDGDFAALASTNNTASVISVPTNLIVEATGPTGSVVSFTASATDVQDGPVTPTSVPSSGSTFPLGTNLVIVTASDSGGLSATNTFQIIVRDTTPPVITVPLAITAEATGSNGATVNFNVSATDIVSGGVSAMANPASGSMFPMGSNTVIVTASDAAGNSATNVFQIIVRDTTPPVIMMLGANPYTNFQGVAYMDPGATAYDIVAGSVPLATNSNVNVNTLGTYTVQYTAADAAGNSATNARTVQVVAIPVPANLNGAAVSGGGKQGAFQLSFTGAIGQPYRILGSTDLIQWSVLTSGTVTTNPVTFTDLGAATNPAGYYRIVSP
ncbi:MAG: HYR domain-containing protein, partial [Verrucomicrobiota bacterium]